MHARIILPLFLLVVSGCTGQAAIPEPLRMVRIFTVGDQATGPSDELTGTVAARIESTLAFREPGRITQRLVSDGETVRTGQLLARIDSADLVEGMTAARARRVAAQRSVDAARATADRTTADERRLRGLAEAGAISQREYDAALEASRAARARIEAAQADVQAANADASVQRNRRGYAELRAGAPGIISAILAEPGQVVAAGTPVLRLAEAGQREIVVDVPEQRRNALPRTATGKLYGGGTVSAVLREVGGAANSATRTYRARYRILDATPPLGSTVTLSFKGAAANDSYAVPNGAVTERGGGPGVWTIERGDKVAWHAVTVVTTDGEQATVDGLRAGTRVVALGAHLLQPGQAVRIAAPAAAVMASR